MTFAARLGIIFVAILFANRISPGLMVEEHWYQFFWAFVLSLLNAFIRTFCDGAQAKRTWPKVILMSLALNLFAYWLIFIGAFEWMGLYAVSYGSAFFATVIVTIVSSICNHYIGVKIKPQ